MFQIIIISILAVIVGLLGFVLAMQLTHYVTKRPVSFDKLLEGLKPKLWMTAGLGVFFTCFYLLIVIFISWMLDGTMRQELFSMAYRHPTYFIYGGLGVFAFISLGILVIRGVIKRVYNSKR